MDYSVTQVLYPVKERQADQMALSLLEAGHYDPRALLAAASRPPSAQSGSGLRSGSTGSGENRLLEAGRIRFLQKAANGMPQKTAGFGRIFCNDAAVA